MAFVQYAGVSPHYPTGDHQKGRPIAVHFEPLPRLYQGMASVSSVELPLVQPCGRMWIDLAHPSSGCMWHWSKPWVDGTVQSSRPPPKHHLNSLVGQQCNPILVVRPHASRRYPSNVESAPG